MRTGGKKEPKPGREAVIASPVNIDHGQQGDRGLLYGEACFETMRVIDGQVFGWDAHLDRLSRGLAAFGLPCPDGLLQACREAAVAQGDDCLLRLTVSGGQAARGLLVGEGREPVVHIQAWPYQPPVEPIRLRSLTWPHGGMARTAKFTADYAVTIRLLQQARHAGELAADEQAMFTHDGELLCMETGNLMLRVDGEWRTPEHAAVLPGVIRGALIRAGAVRAVACPVEWALACDAMAVCNSGGFIRPVASVDGRSLETLPALFEPLLAVIRSRPGIPADL